MEWFSNSACLSTQQYNASNLSMDSRIPSLSRKCIHPHNKQWFKTVHEYFKDFDEQHRLPYDKAVLETSRRHPYSFRERYREKSIVFTPPPSPRHRGFRFPAVQHTPCPFRLQSNASNLSMDLLRHFKTQWIPLRNKGTVPGRSFEKSLY
ncbi:hypothetical protein TNCT_149841 [Trichonephila clavata]|uniref:Uncharacterized protein n=1 Tax=Trichonephila clavata TaxID=2740835 RepID=A0A8X6KNI3_TRICU|nr:hypothetical protein TNCT_149841 [Trichonephila clavata]